MNKTEYEMIEILKVLKYDYNVSEIKAEFENEGTRLGELMKLKDITSKVDLPIIIKIGGVEAVTDMYYALNLGVKGIVAPMGETAFAISKFINAIKKFITEEDANDIEFAINIETITAYHNFSEILSINDINILTSITIGRVDFTSSLGKDRNYVNSDEMLNYCIEIFEKCKKYKFKCCLGGAISPNSVPFINKLIALNLLDKFETRKVVYHKDAASKDIKKGILKGIEFELLWLKNKREYYQSIKKEDEKRITMLEKRLMNH